LEKAWHLITSSGDERDECKRTADDASKMYRWHQNRGRNSVPGKAWRIPTYWPYGVRCIGGVNLIRAFVRNLRTWQVMVREKVQAQRREAETTDAPARGGLPRSSGEAG